MLTTGMLIFGKISVGVRTIASTPMTRMRMASTTNVYGLRNASLTIHMALLALCSTADDGCLVDQLPEFVRHEERHFICQTRLAHELLKNRLFMAISLVDDVFPDFSVTISTHMSVSQCGGRQDPLRDEG